MGVRTVTSEYRQTTEDQIVMALAEILQSIPVAMVCRRQELAEIFGFETRNKYLIEDEKGAPIAFAAEQQRGILGFFFRQSLGHWRSFEIFIFGNDREIEFRARHPFRLFFQRLEVFGSDERPIGAVARRFGILRKKFDVLSADGRLLLSVSSPFWRLWTFPFMRDGTQRAIIQKKWSGLLQEAVTDADNFRVEFSDPALNKVERILVLVASIYIDLLYFENKASSRANILLERL